MLWGVYRLVNAAGTVIFWGFTNRGDLPATVTMLRAKPWWVHVDHVDYRIFDNRDAAIAAYQADTWTPQGTIPAASVQRLGR